MGSITADVDHLETDEWKAIISVDTLFQLDTGAAVTIIGENDMPRDVQLQPADRPLKGPGDTKLTCMGKFEATLMYKDSCLRDAIYTFLDNTPTLCSKMCLCEYCTNAQLKLRTVNAVAARINNNCRVRHINHGADLVTCGREDGKYRKPCAYGYCPNCSPRNLANHLQPLMGHQLQVSWLKWESSATIANGKRVTRKMLVRKHGTMTELTAELTFLAAHLFRADWQHSQFELMRKERPFPPKTVGTVLDFAENFTCAYQDEVQAAHWHHEEVTVHPIVTYYACPSCAETTTESLVFISNDRTHDFNAVHSFTPLAIQHLRGRGLPVEAVVQWTDGCPFSDISYGLQDHGCTLERHYFGSRHGKGPSDGESAVVKHSAMVAVRTSRAVITSARDLNNYCIRNQLNKQPLDTDCQHFLRSFFFVDAEDIRRSRNRPVKTLKGTRALHAVRTSKRGVVGAIDGTCVPIPGPSEHRDSYINRKDTPSMQVQVVSNHSLLFLDVLTGWPCSMHNARVFRNSPLKQLLEDRRMPQEYHLIGDSTYPLTPYLLVPFRDDGHLSPVQRRYNARHSSTRVDVERSIGLLKGKFRRLKF
ncbi:hypothetical protein BaRGS_00029939 [Batillaria attramentaria]|uniref:Peptidase A2 domain-containing protein n=1 Tax=Batillaria attramentaria TaxID=370345 RepID=A0ABD0JW70_9CAEN